MAKIQLGSLPLTVDSVLEHLRTPLYRNGYALIISTGITSALGLLYWAVAARAYDTDNVGLNSTAISIMIFLSSVAQINLQETMIRFIPQAGTRTLRLVVTAYAIVIALSALIGVLFCLGIALWSPDLAFLAESPAAILWFACALVLWGIFVIEDSVLMGLRQALWIPLENAIFSAFKIVLLLVLAATFPQNGIFLSWTAALILIIVPINVLIFRRLIPRYVRQAATTTPPAPLSLRQISKYVAGNYTAALLSSMASALMPLLIVHIAGATANAHFYLAWVIAGSLQIIAANMSSSLTVEAAHHSDNLAEYKRRATIGIARLLLPMVVLLVLGAPLILRLVGQSYSDEGTVLLQLLAIAAISNLFNMVYVGTARVQNRMAGVIGVYGTNAVLVLGLSVVLLPIYGISGVGLAWVISQSGIALTLAVLPKLRVFVTKMLAKEY